MLEKYVGGQEELSKNYPATEPNIVLGCGRLFTSESPLSVVSVIKTSLCTGSARQTFCFLHRIGRQRIETTS